MNTRNIDDEEISEVQIAIENQPFGGVFLVNNKVDETYINPLKIKFDDIDELEKFIENCQKAFSGIKTEIEKYNKEDK